MSGDEGLKKSFALSGTEKKIISFLAALFVVFSGSTAVANALDYGETVNTADSGLYNKNIVTPDSVNHIAGIFTVNETSGVPISGLYAYCVEAGVASRESNGKIVNWADYNKVANDTSLKDDANKEKINWILHNAYPLLSEQELGEKVGVKNPKTLSKADAVGATQAAIWYYSDGLDLSDAPAIKNNDNVKKIYEYLTGSENVGRKENTSGSNRTGAFLDNEKGQKKVVVDDTTPPDPEPTPGADFRGRDHSRRDHLGNRGTSGAEEPEDRYVGRVC